MNIDKTEWVIFGLRSRDEVFTLDHGGATISSKSSIKFLGLVVDDQLRWCDHIHFLSTKLNKAYYAISRIKGSLNLKSLIDIYYGPFHSHLSYNILLWGNSVSVERILISQKRILRLIFGLSSRTSCIRVFADRMIMTVASLYK